MPASSLPAGDGVDAVVGDDVEVVDCGARCRPSAHAHRATASDPFEANPKIGTIDAQRRCGSRRSRSGGATRGPGRAP